MLTAEARLAALRRELRTLLLAPHPDEKRSDEQRAEALADALWTVLAPRLQPDEPRSL